MLHVMLLLVMLGVKLSYCYAEVRYVECYYYAGSHVTILLC